MSYMLADYQGGSAWWRTHLWHTNKQERMSDMATGMRAVLGRSAERLDLIAENLANANTPGYRTSTMLPKNFVGELTGRLVGHQWRVATDMSEGAIRPTERPLDFALHGDGFFVVRTPNADLLTRNGSFEITPDGTLTTASGYPVIGTNGQPLRIPLEASLHRLEVGEDGSLRADGNDIGTFRLERPETERDMRRVGTTLFAVDEDFRLPAEQTRVIGRSLESSNATVYQEMTDMMVLNRSVEAAQRAQTSETESQKKMYTALS